MNDDSIDLLSPDEVLYSAKKFRTQANTLAAEVERAEAALSQAKIEWDAATARAERAETEVTRLRALADDPTTNPYWRSRSERAEAALAVYREDAAEAVAALALIVAQRDAAVIANTELRRQVDAVRALADLWSGGGYTLGRAAYRLLTALDGPTDTEGAPRG